MADPSPTIALEVLQREYDTLRAEILHRSNARFALLPTSITVVAAVLGFAPDDAMVPRQVVAWLLALYLLLMYLVWLWTYANIRTISTHLMDLESRINQIALTGQVGAEPLLSWETHRRSSRRGRGF